MKKILVLTFLALFLLSVNAWAVDQVKNDPAKKQEKTSARTKKAEPKKYDNFTDQNHNGINDKDEQKQKNTTRVEPKREQSKTEQYQPDNSETNPETKPDSSLKEATVKAEKAEKK